MNTQVHVTRTLVLLLLPLLIGCNSQRRDFTAQQLAAPELRAQAADVYWKRHNVPDMRNRGYKRIALLDFSVEFVTVKMESPFGTQAMLSAPPATPPQSDIAFSALERRHNKFEPQLYKKLADEMHAQLVKILEGRGLEVVSPSAVTAARAYKRFSTLPRAERTPGQTIGMAGSDAGRVKQTVTYPATGLQIINGARNEDIEDVEADLLKELSADIALRVRVRVGVFRGRAALEYGSTVWVLTRDVIGNLSSVKSLLSDNHVVTDQDDMLTHGRAYHIDSEQYLAAVRELFPIFVDMAFLSGGQER